MTSAMYIYFYLEMDKFYLECCQAALSFRRESILRKIFDFHTYRRTFSPEGSCLAELSGKVVQLLI